MSGRRRHTLAPSLFPFLAVLVCTLGTLILLLALVAQTATDAAEQSARQQQQAARQEVAQTPQLTAAAAAAMIDEESFRVERLVAVRDQQTADVEQRRDRLTHLEDHIARLREQLERLASEVQRATGSAPSNVIDQSLIEQLQNEIQQQELALSELRAASDDAAPRVVIVPHKGPNGTDRRPIYIECSASGVTIWPEGSTISTLHLEDSNPMANPLDAALRAIRLHTMRDQDNPIPPYPLLIVRPEGVDSYAAARKAMSDWDDQFGYELVPGEVKLAFPKADPTLKQRIEVAIRQATGRQAAQQAIASRTSGRPLHELPTLSAASLDRQGRAGGFRQHREPSTASRSGSPYVSGPNPAAANQYAANSYATGQFAGNQFVANGGGPQGQSEAVRRLDQHLRAAADELSSSRDQQGQPLASPAAQLSGTQLTDDVLDAMQQSNPFTALPTSEQQSPAAAANRSDLSATEQTMSVTEQSMSATEQTKSAPRAMSASRAGNGDGQGNAKQAAPQGALDQSPRPPTQELPDSSAEQLTPNQRPPGTELVKRQGRDWALPKSLDSRYGNAIIRTIRVECHPDRFVLLPAASGGPTEVFGYSDGQINRATLQLATAVRDRVARWGAALPGGRWQPRLEVAVMRHGDARFHQLQTLMHGSGVEVTRGTAP